MSYEVLPEPEDGRTADDVSLALTGVQAGAVPLTPEQWAERFKGDPQPLIVLALYAAVIGGGPTLVLPEVLVPVKGVALLIVAVENAVRDVGAAPALAAAIDQVRAEARAAGAPGSQP